MCGLAGIFRRAASAEVDRALLARMSDAIAHRGPDGDGFHVEPGVGFAHRRLAIIDPTGGHQPMFNEDGSVAILFNGMIYNFQELRPKLQALGHVFATDHSDTETIIHAWESWGPDCLQHLSGFFAIALWDRNRGQLFLARDRLGKKPLHYATTASGDVVFASELRALTCVPGIDLTLAPESVEDFFAHGYIPDPATIYRGIRKLPAGHYMVLDRSGTPATPRRYWRLDAAPNNLTEAEAVQRLPALLDACVSKRLVADVRLGAFLSGGVDSSAVVARAAMLKKSPLTTFTIGFDGAEDETPYASLIAARYGTDQHVERAAATDMIDAARLQGAIFGEPFGDQSSVPTHTVCALARRHVTVAISGDGGDEVFAGYRRYRWHMLNEAVRAWIPAPLRRHALGTLARLYPKLDRAPRWLRAKYTLTELSLDSALGYARTLTKTHAEERHALFAPGLRAALDGHDPMARVADLMDESGTEDALARAQYVDVNLYLVGDILTKVDRASMANALEVRAPFLDQDMVAWGIGLPPALKLQGGAGKYVLKKAMEPSVPHEILYRPKQGFATSLAAPFRARAATLRTRLLCGPMAECGLFDHAAIARMLDAHESGAFDHTHALWLLLVFEGFLASECAGQPVLARAPEPALA